MGKGQTAGNREPGIPDKKKGRMKDHARILKQGVHAVALIRRIDQLDKGITYAGQQKQKKSLDQEKEQPEPDLRFLIHEPVPGGKNHDGPQNGEHQCPEEKRSVLPGPKGGHRIECGQKGICIFLNIQKGKIPIDQGKGKNPGTQQQKPRTGQLSPFHPYQNRISVFGEIETTFEGK
jgi:hypothetical protein